MDVINEMSISEKEMKLLMNFVNERSKRNRGYRTEEQQDR